MCVCVLYVSPCVCVHVCVSVCVVCVHVQGRRKIFNLRVPSVKAEDQK